MTPKNIKVVAIVAVVAVAGYWYWSPFLAVRQLQSAAQKKDADAFNERVDYPKLRESLKGQFSALMGEMMVKSEDNGNGFAALGTMLGLAMVNQMVDAMVRPETIMRAMQDGQLSPKAKQSNEVTTPENPDKPTTVESQNDKPKWTYERKNVDKLVVYATNSEKSDESNQDKFGLVFQRSGFANWKLTEVRLPPVKK